MSEEGAVRSFLALPRDRMWVEAARGLLSRVRPALPEASWTRESSWHLTLKFLGEISRERARAFAEALRPEALATVPGELDTDGAIVFPPRGPARVLGVGFSPSEALARVVELAVAAERLARRVGVAPEDREFHPHVTLARLRRPWPPEKVELFRQEVAGWTFPPWHARSCVLCESRLEREGTVHTPLEEWSFTGGPRGVPA